MTTLSQDAGLGERGLQNTLLAAWRGLAGFEQRGSVRTWLYRGATNRCVNALPTAQAALNPTDATACWDAGGELSLADAVAYARRGRGQRRRPQFGWASLTPVERDVVRLVAEGHSNAEIGRRLFVSVNTVKKYLSRVYTKVDVEGRAGLAAQVARRDL